MDDFERRLASALKTAAAHLPVDPEVHPAARQIDLIPPSPHRGRVRPVLAAAVVVVLVVAAGGAWWATGNRGDHAPPADGRACAAADVVGSQLPTEQGQAFVARIGLRARTACTLASTPTLLLDANPVFWRSADVDAVDATVWTPITLTAGQQATFGVRATVDTTAYCPAMVERQVTFRFGVDARGSALSFQRSLVSACTTFSFTTVDPPPPPASDASTPCTASDLRIVPHDTGEGIDAVGLDVVAVVGCTLEQPPTVRVDALVATSDVRGIGVPPWMPTRLATGQSVTLTLNANYLGTCAGSPYRSRQVRANVGGTELASFGWTTLVSCAGLTFGLEPRYHVAIAEHPCTAADLSVELYTVATSPVTIRITSRSGTTTCTLVDPPTVVVGGAVASFGNADNGYTYGGWSTATVGPDDDVLLALVYLGGPADCPSIPTHDDVSVSVGGGVIGSGFSARRGCEVRPVVTLV